MKKATSCRCNYATHDANGISTEQKNCSVVGRTVKAFAQWLIPGVTLMLIPKCPVCLAGYIALFTGVSLSLTTAAWLRGLLILLCLTTLVLLLVRKLRGIHHSRNVKIKKAV